MDLSGVKPGDLLEVDVRGRRFHAEFVGRENSTVTFKPLSPRHSERSCGSRAVKGVWRATAATRRAKGLGK